MKNVNSRIREIRLKKGMSAMEVATELEINLFSYYKYEKPGYNVNVSRKKHLEEIFGEEI